MQSVDEIVESAFQQGASDIHITADQSIRFRIDGQLVEQGSTPVGAEMCERLAHEMAGDDFEGFGTQGEIDLARSYGHGVRCRINIYRTSVGYNIALRLLADTIPEMESLGLPPAMFDFPNFNKGIVIITGETGSGKSTTLASILERVNKTRRDHIITLEDPIEYVYEPKSCSVSQREIGRDTNSYADGLRASLREDPDVILIGEMRDLDTIETALTAAETGHLVFATLHTQSAADSIDRMVDVFPVARQHQIRLQLSQTLRAVVAQQLMVRKEGTGRIVACEVMIVNAAIRNLIREAKTPQIENTIATSAKEGSITMDNMLLTMVQQQIISRDTAIEHAHDREYLKRLIR